MVRAKKITPQEIIRRQAEAIKGFRNDVKQVIPKNNESKIVKLEYNERQRNFHVCDVGDNKSTIEWEVLSSQMIEEDAVKFIGFIDGKYQCGRKNGRNPDLETVQLELRLFLKQKDYRRKYS